VYDGVTFTFASPNGQPGIEAAVFDVPGRGIVRL
ncbi:MAG TPA: VOC family protein, partial [Propionibacteriaceae bacterium]|nr:VOC family protein [Propionibacteriaceae bacterium]